MKTETVTWTLKRIKSLQNQSNVKNSLLLSVSEHFKFYCYSFLFSENYAAMNDDELTVIKGESVTVTIKFCDGWFECSRGNNRGKVPATVVRPDRTGADDDLSIRRAIPKRRQSISKRK